MELGIRVKCRLCWDMKRKILFVDDDLDTRMVVAMHLRTLGYETLTVEDAGDALEVAAENHVDVIILDVNLFGMDGPELMTELQQLNPEVPIVLYSGMSRDSAKVKQMLAMGAHQFISKNAPLNDIIKALQSTLSAVH